MLPETSHLPKVVSPGWYNTSRISAPAQHTFSATGIEKRAFGILAEYMDCAVMSCDTLSIALIVVKARRANFFLCI